MRFARLDLFKKLLFGFVIVLLPVLALLIYGYDQAVRQQETALLNGQVLTAEAVASQVETVFDDAVGFAWAVATMPGVSTMDPTRLDPLLKRLALLNPQFDSINVFDARGLSRGYGHVRLSAKPRLSIADRAHFKVVMATNAPVVSNVLPLRKPTGTQGVVAAVPIRNAAGKPVGMASVVLAASELAKHFEETRLQPGQAFFLSDRDGLLAFHTLRRVTSREEQRVFLATPEVRVALSGQVASSRAFRSPLVKDLRVAAFVPTRTYHWVVGVTIPRDVALAQAYADLRNNLVAFVFLFLFSGALAALLARHFVEPVRRLTQAAEVLGQGHLEHRVSISTGDEIERLGIAFNRMAEGLQERQAERDRLILQEQEARVEAEAMKQLDKLKSDFVNAVSHELRTPLTTIKGYTEFLEDELGGPMTPEQLAYVQQIEQSTERLHLLVEDLLDFARMESGTFRLRCEEADLRRPIQQTLESLQPQAQEARVALESRLPETPVMARMDTHRITQVLLNLLNNAIKFTPDGGRIEVRARAEGDVVRCEVNDTGIGIPPEDVPKLFQRFAQLEPGVRKVGGTGLGLSISKAIIEAHGGAIGVDSEPGVGSTFWFTLPRGA